MLLFCTRHLTRRENVNESIKSRFLWNTKLSEKYFGRHEKHCLLWVDRYLKKETRQKLYVKDFTRHIKLGTIHCTTTFDIHTSFTIKQLVVHSEVHYRQHLVEWQKIDNNLDYFKHKLLSLKKEEEKTTRFEHGRFPNNDWNEMQT